MEKIWFTSDTHFGHQNILKFCPNTRRGANADEMTQLMIAAWQSRVHQNDHIYLLGDVFFCNAEKAMRILDQLPGQKHLILGNHDQVIKSNSSLRNKFVSVREYHETVFAGYKTVLFHYPIYEWNRMHHGSFHFYGHVHGNCTVPGRAIDVGIDGELSTGLMCPYTLEEIVERIKNREIRTHHGNSMGNM